MTDQAPELLPCPLCNATLVLSGGYTHETAWNFWCHPDRDAQCILADYQIPTAQDMRTPLAHEAKMWNTRPTPAERPVPMTDAQIEDEVVRLGSAIMDRQAERPVPQVREALVDLFIVERQRHLEHVDNNSMGDYLAGFDDATEIALSAALTAARPSDAAVAWTNEAQLGFLRDPNYSKMPMAMWADRGFIDDIPLYRAIPHEEAVRAQTIEECIATFEASFTAHGSVNTAIEAMRALAALQPSKE